MTDLNSLVSDGKERIVSAVNGAVSAVLTALFILYSVFGSDFAEVRLLFSFLNFPIFVGEVSLLFCLLCFAIRFYIKRPKINRWAWVFGCFSIWILLKAFSGYAIYGALAFRHAAMFYYAFFAVFSFNVLSDREIPCWLWAVCFFLLIVLVRFGGILGYFLMMYFVLCCLCIVQFRGGLWKFLGTIILLLIFPVQKLFDGGTSLILGNTGAIIVFMTASFFAVKKTRKRVKAFFGIGLLLTIISGMVFFAPRWEVRTLITPKTIWSDFVSTDRLIQKKRAHFGPRQIKAQIYKDNRAEEKKTGRVRAARRESLPNVGVTQQEKQVLSSIAYNNVLFRLFIWRDMIKEFLHYRSVWGLPFGYPLRSYSIEILHQAEGQWGRDGWIEPHNSFLNMIYRGGIVGFLLVGAMVFWIWKFFSVFVRSGSYRGILMTAVLIQWSIVAFFLVVYELPYYAIPIWMWWGMTYFYYRKREKEIEIRKQIF